MEDHIPIRPDRSLLLGRRTTKWSLWDGLSMKITFIKAEYIKEQRYIDIETNQPFLVKISHI